MIAREASATLGPLTFTARRVVRRVDPDFALAATVVGARWGPRGVSMATDSWRKGRGPVTTWLALATWRPGRKLSRFHRTEPVPF